MKYFCIKFDITILKKLTLKKGIKNGKLAITLEIV